MAEGAAPDAPTQVLHSNGAAPRLADGLELIGQSEGSGLKETPYLVRRADGQVIQLPELLYLVVESLDGGDLERAAERVSEASGRGVSADDVQYLVDEKLRPLGLIAGADGAAPEGPPKPD